MIFKEFRSARALAVGAASIAAGIGGVAVTAPAASAGIMRNDDCTVNPNTWCRMQVAHYAYVQVSAGMYNFAGDPSTGYGWWCAKLRDDNTGAEYGRRCDFARAVTTAISSAPSSRMEGWIANGNNAYRQHIIGFASTYRT